MAAVTYAAPIQPRRTERGPAHLASVTRNPHRVNAGTYRRRRLGVAMLATLVLLGAGMVLGRLGAGPLASVERSSGPQLIAEHTHVVTAGETDWSIARAAQPSGDVRPLVEYLADQHSGRALQVGDVLTLP